MSYRPVRESRILAEYLAESILIYEFNIMFLRRSLVKTIPREK